ncbi:hypothetical protein HanXRQr2_Chr09g0370351 [Helianthus annuus]|uniref:Uncharacterized protein n=1 Tax=Helianthus annuus TaxID=4232 RepID=A0A9K3I2R5_HELAN|nr:hypothetical protein HanXRQr2_Chr09g0370351 [Helianthus annuus]
MKQSTDTSAPTKRYNGSNMSNESKISRNSTYKGQESLPRNNFSVLKTHKTLKPKSNYKEQSTP